MTPLAGTGPRAAGLVAPERLERHGVGTLSDAVPLTILAGPNGGRAADAVLDEREAVQGLPQERAGETSRRIDGVTPRAAAVITAAVERGRRTPGRPRSGAPGPRRFGAGTRRPAVDTNRCPWSATGAALQRAGPPDDDHAGRGAAWRGADAVHRHAADDPAVATILTSAHRPDSREPTASTRITVAFSAGRISTAHTTAAAARANLAALRRQNALVTAADADPSRPVPIPGAPRRQPAWIAVDPSTPTTHLDPP